VAVVVADGPSQAAEELAHLVEEEALAGRPLPKELSPRAVRVLALVAPNPALSGGAARVLAHAVAPQVTSAAAVFRLSAERVRGLVPGMGAATARAVVGHWNSLPGGEMSESQGGY